uniref:Copia protein n=1 Tax=Culex pipiens TaxID=7175 RepID=A0A8D8NT61_CULPI
MDAPGMFSFTRLNNQNWRFWSFRMEALLRYDNRWYVVHESAPVPVTDRWDEDDRKANATICLSIDDDQICHVRGATTAAESWERLRRFHEAPHSEVALMQKFSKLRLPEGGNVHEHLAQLDDLFWRMKLSGLGVEDKSKIPMMFVGLPDSYDVVFKALEWIPEAEQTMFQVRIMIVREYDRQQMMKRAEKQEEASTGTSKPTAKCHLCKQAGHKRNQCPMGARAVAF